MSLPAHVPNRELVLRKIPSADAPYEVLERFALTFHGYQALPNGLCERIANERRQGTLTELRACLFFEQRRYRHFGYGPEGEQLEYVRDLVRQIRQRVELAERLLA